MFKERDKIYNLKASLSKDIYQVSISHEDGFEIVIPQQLIEKIKKMDEIQNIFNILLADFQKNVNHNIDDPEISELHFRKLSKDWIDDWYNKLTDEQKKDS